jgi:serine protease Do
MLLHARIGSWWCCLVVMFTASLHAAEPSASAERVAAPRSADAERIYDESRPRLLQIRTLTRATGSQFSIGSGFMVAADLAVTNFHVVSEWITSSSRHQLEWVSTDKQRGPLAVLAIDLAHDLAVVRLEGKPPELEPYRLAAQEPRRGERVFALGRPLDLGFNIVEGTHNGLVEGDFREQYHFSGAINAGMSGGPAVNQAGDVFGINVARNLRGDLISYLVPARFARALLANLPSKPPTAEALRQSMNQQLSERQQGLMAKLFAQPLPTRRLGRFSVNGEIPTLLKCWSRAQGSKPNRAFGRDSLSCEVDASLFLGNDLTAGDVSIEHVRVRSNAFSGLRFTALASAQHTLPNDRLSRGQAGFERCDDQFVTLGQGSWRVSRCLRALRKFDDMYQLRLAALSLDTRPDAATGEREALSARMLIDAASFADISRATQRFLETLR